MSLVEEGRSLFFRQLAKEFRFHPRAFSLIERDADRIFNAESVIPHLYPAVLELLYREKAGRFPFPPQSNEETDPRFRAAWLDLCQEGASRFVESLFMREPIPLGVEKGRSVLDFILESLGVDAPGTPVRTYEASGPSDHEGEPLSLLSKDPALREMRIRPAHAVTEGRGVRIEVIGPDVEQRSGKESGLQEFPWKPQIDREGTEVRTYASAAAQAAAPKAEIRFRPVRRAGNSPYRYWVAVETALAVREAARDGAMIEVVTQSFSLDYPFLREACTEAAGNNVVIVCVIGPGTGEGPEVPQCFPAHYGNTLAVAAAAAGNGGRLAPVPGAATHFTDLTALAPLSDRSPDPAAAAGFCAGTVALVASLMPPGEEELFGQYFQRIREILVRSADPGQLSGNYFDPATGYGLLDAVDATGKDLEDYRKRSGLIEENFKMRLKAIEEEQKKTVRDSGREKKSEKKE